MKFLDLSNWNNVTNYEAVANDYNAVICKASEGTTFIDKTFDDKINNLKKVGIKCGAYHYLRRGNEAEQADLFYSLIKNKELEILPVIDVEDNDLLGDVYGCTKRFYDRFLEISGQKCLIYSGQYYCKDNFTFAQRREFNWWLASYGVSNPPRVDGADLVAWQYTSEEKVNGIPGNVDANICYMSDYFFTNTSISTLPPVAVSGTSYEENGVAKVVVDILNIRNDPSTNAEKVGSYSYGEEFFYNYVIIDGGYVWVRYTSFSGHIRYVAVKNQITGERYAECR